MAKTFDTKSVTAKFFTPSTLDTQSASDKHDTPNTSNTLDTQETQNKPSKHGKHNKSNKLSADDTQNKSDKPSKGRPPKAEEEKLRGYRYNLNLDRDLKEYLHEIAWRQRTSITQYLNDLIREDMAEKIGAGEWEQVEK